MTTPIPRARLSRVSVLHVIPSMRTAPLAHVVKAGDQIGDRGLTGPTRPDQSHQLARRSSKRGIFAGPDLRWRPGLLRRAAVLGHLEPQENRVTLSSPRRGSLLRT